MTMHIPNLGSGLHRGLHQAALISLYVFNLIAIAGVAYAHEPNPSVQNGAARYLANEGVLVELGDTKILFDAFFSNSYGNYALVPAAKVAALHAGSAPYDGIDALFISHAHGDHFSPAPTLAYMRAQPTVLLFGPAEAVSALQALLPADDPLAKRLTAFTLNPRDAAVTLSVADIDIEVVAILSHPTGFLKGQTANTYSTSRFAPTMPRECMFPPQRRARATNGDNAWMQTCLSSRMNNALYCSTNIILILIMGRPRNEYQGTARV